MKSIQNQYRDLKEGKMSQANFMRNLRMNLPQYITNVTSFNDAVKILKNKAILTESGTGDAPISKMSRKDMIDFLNTTEEKVKDMSDEELRDAVIEKNEDIKENDDDDAEVEDMIAKAEEEESGKYTKFQDVPGTISEEYDFPRDAEDMADLVVNKYGKELAQLSGVQREKWALSHAYKTILNSGHPDARAIARNLNSDEDWSMDFVSAVNDKLGRDKMNEGKGKELHPNQIHPQELRMGIKVELEHTDDLDKAKKIALGHLAENPYYYTALKLSGVESPSKLKEKPVKEKKATKKSNKIELVDLVNGMKKVKMPKADEKKKLKENLNEGGEWTITGTLTKDEIAKLKDIIGDFDIDVQEADDTYETTISSAKYNDKSLEHAIKQARGTLPKVNAPEKYRAFQSKLEALVKEVIAEYYFDGRDNLIDDIASTEK